MQTQVNNEEFLNRGHAALAAGALVKGSASKGMGGGGAVYIPSSSDFQPGAKPPEVAPVGSLVTSTTKSPTTSTAKTSITSTSTRSPISSKSTGNNNVVNSAAGDGENARKLPPFRDNLSDARKPIEDFLLENGWREPLPFTASDQRVLALLEVLATRGVPGAKEWRTILKDLLEARPAALQPYEPKSYGTGYK